MKGRNLKLTFVSVFATMVIIAAAFCFAPASYADDVPVTGIHFEKDSVTIDKEKTIRLKYTISPEDATNHKITWHSSDPSIVQTLDKYGKVVGHKIGTAIVTAVTADGHYTDTIEVHVVEPEQGVSGTVLILTFAVAGMLILIGAFIVVGRQKGVI